jgi:hypothetical protein
VRGLRFWKKFAILYFEVAKKVFKSIWKKKLGNF